MNIPESPESYPSNEWTVTKSSGGIWWAECPDDNYEGCLCESFDTQAEALAHVAKHAKEAPNA